MPTFGRNGVRPALIFWHFVFNRCVCGPGAQLDEYLLSFWWVTSTLTAVGTSEGEARNETERWFAMCLMLLNLSLFAYVLGTISSLFMSADEQLVAARDKTPILSLGVRPLSSSR